MSTNQEQPTDGEEPGMPSLEVELAALVSTLENLSAALGELLAAMRRPEVRLQLTLDLRAPALGDHDAVRWN